MLTRESLLGAVDRIVAPRASTSLTGRMHALIDSATSEEEVRACAGKVEALVKIFVGEQVAAKLAWELELRPARPS
jgi:hypothetical protein